MSASSIRPSPCSSLGYATHFQVGLIVHDTSNKFIMIAFPFLLSKDFSPKYHSFKSALLCRIVSVSTEQGLFIDWDFGPKHRLEYKNEKKSYGSMSIHGITIAGKKEYIE